MYFTFGFISILDSFCLCLLIEMAFQMNLWDDQSLPAELHKQVTLL